MPRTATLTKDPTDNKIAAITAKVTTTSIRVKPAEPRASLQGVKRYNFNAPREPIDADLVADTEPRQLYHAATRHAGGEKYDHRPGLALITAAGQSRIELHILRRVNRVRRKAPELTDRPSALISVAIARGGESRHCGRREDGGNLQRIGLLRERDVPRGISGNKIAASRPIMARTQTTSMRVKPPSPRARSTAPTDDVSGRSCSAFLTVGAI